MDPKRNPHPVIGTFAYVFRLSACKVADPRLNNNYWRRTPDEIARSNGGCHCNVDKHCRSPKSAATNADTAAPGTTPADHFTVTNYYKQDVYDKADNKIGTIDDVLIDKQGKITALIIGVGGFLGIGQKDVSEPFSKVQMTKKNDKWYLVMDADKEALKNSPSLKYDRNATTWVPENADTDRTKTR